MSASTAKSTPVSRPPLPEITPVLPSPSTPTAPTSASASDPIVVFAACHYHGHDLILGGAHLGRCRLGRDVLMVELVNLPRDGRLYIPIHDIVTLYNDLQKKAPAVDHDAWVGNEKEGGVGHA